MKNLKIKKGFSLVELLVVITIIAILSVVAYTAVGGQTTKAKNSRRMQDIGTIQTALEAYFISEGRYPKVDGVTYDGGELDKKYISKKPVDPWSKDGNPVHYVYGVSGKTYQLAATLEIDDTYKAYVVGNGGNILKGIEWNEGAKKFGAQCTTLAGTCVPYKDPNI